ncbi:hypothetical protein HYR99_29590 [Candidatus Poribacteria bacterium]|nr:hypothetical protein [Candidatus Poribacteria bacterium]
MTSKANLMESPSVPDAQDTVVEYYTDPVDEWLTEQSKEWSEKYQGKCLAIIDCQVVAVKDTREAAFKVFDKYPDKIPFVWYVPTEEEMEMLV